MSVTEVLNRMREGFWLVIEPNWKTLTFDAFLHDPVRFKFTDDDQMIPEREMRDRIMLSWEPAQKAALDPSVKHIEEAESRLACMAQGGGRRIYKLRTSEVATC